MFVLPLVRHKDQLAFSSSFLQSFPLIILTNFSYFLIHNSQLFYFMFSIVILIHQHFKVLFPSHTWHWQYISIPILNQPNLLHILSTSIPLPCQPTQIMLSFFPLQPSIAYRSTTFTKHSHLLVLFSTFLSPLGVFLCICSYTSVCHHQVSLLALLFPDDTPSNLLAFLINVQTSGSTSYMSLVVPNSYKLVSFFHYSMDPFVPAYQPVVLQSACQSSCFPHGVLQILSWLIIIFRSFFFHKLFLSTWEVCCCLFTCVL